MSSSAPFAPTAIGSLGSGALIIALTIAAFLIKSFIKHRRAVARTPPSPRPLPFLGNILDIPSEKPWETYAEWAARYKSDLVSVRVLGQLSIVINTEEAAQELLARRAHIYSDKPNLTMFEIEEWDWSVALMPYGDRWRNRRRLLHQNLNSTVIKAYLPAQRIHINRFLIKLLNNPGYFLDHIKHLTTGIAMAITYAHDVKEMNDPFVKTSEQAVLMLSLSSFPGAVMVNVLPILRHLPEGFPGAGFQKFARECRELTRKMRYEPLDMVKKKMANGTASPSLARSLLESDIGVHAADKELIADVTGIVFAGASDTLMSTLSSLISAFALYPEVQHRAQAEIDSVIGRDRLPAPEDKDLLPYVGAICKEILRWRVVTPLGVTLKTLHDDVYNGQYIPKGTNILWNAWALAHDPKVFSDPYSFKPERWLDSNGSSINEEFIAAFGYGRRHCVGISLAKNVIWLTTTSLLATLEFTRSTDKNGNEIDISLENSGGIILHPVPYECDIHPRDNKAVELLESLLLEDEAY